jgi:hypothetical protein
MEKKKKKIRSLKKIRQGENMIEEVDAQTFYVKSSDPDKDPYMVFNSEKKSWLCDCMDFVMSLTDTETNPKCKHIKMVQEKLLKYQK